MFDHSNHNTRNGLHRNGNSFILFSCNYIMYDIVVKYSGDLLNDFYTCHFMFNLIQR